MVSMAMGYGGNEENEYYHHRAYILAVPSWFQGDSKYSLIDRIILVSREVRPNEGNFSGHLRC